MRSLIRTSAPVRLDFAGGWTDVAPFSTTEGGIVVNAAIDLRVHVELSLDSDAYHVHSEEFGIPERSEVMWETGDGFAADLRKAAIRRAQLGPCELRTRSDVPAGSGLGGSGALGVALVAALNAARGSAQTPRQMAEEAFQLEAVEAALPGGKQDQYAAALGGFHRLKCTSQGVAPTPLDLDQGFLDELAEHIILCYTGTSRVSSNTISRVMGAYQNGNPGVVGALRSLGEIADRMAEALWASDLPEVAELLSRNWSCQQQLDAGMQTPEMARLESMVRDAGAIGGKAAGAGAGGSMFFIVRDRKAATQAARDAGAQVIPFAWATSGVTEESR